MRSQRGCDGLALGFGRFFGLGTGRDIGCEHRLARVRELRTAAIMSAMMRVDQRRLEVGMHLLNQFERLGIGHAQRVGG